MNKKIILMKNMFFIVTLLASSNVFVQAMEKNDKPLESYITRAKQDGPLFLVAVYLVNQNNELLLAKSNDIDQWSVPYGVWKYSDDNAKEAACRIVRETTKLKSYNLTYLGYAQKGSDASIEINNEKIYTHIHIENYITRDFTGDTNNLQPSTSTLFSYDSWKWCNQANLPENINGSTLPQEYLYNFFKK